MTERNPGMGLPTSNSSTHPSFSESTVRPREGQLHATPCRILIVDDNVDAADSLHALLMLSGHATCVAYSGADALAAFRSQPFDFALIDICMPDMNGYDLVRHMRVVGRILPVMVAVTGLADDTSRSKARDAGFEHYLVKPYEVEALQTILDFTGRGRVAIDARATRPP
jgi:CheY-like chemotaxis protein